MALPDQEVAVVHIEVAVSVALQAGVRARFFARDRTRSLQVRLPELPGARRHGTPAQSIARGLPGPDLLAHTSKYSDHLLPDRLTELLPDVRYPAHPQAAGKRAAWLDAAVRLGDNLPFGRMVT